MRGANYSSSSEPRRAAQAYKMAVLDRLLPGSRQTRKPRCKHRACFRYRPILAKIHMSSSAGAKRTQLSDDGDEAMPLPADIKVIYLGRIFLILLLASLYAVADIVWPLLFAFILSLLLNPLLRLLVRLHIPRVLCAFFLVAAVLGLVVGLGTAISAPAANWAAKLPDGLPRLFQRLSFLKSPFAAIQHFWQKIENFAGWQEGTNSSVGTAVLTKLLSGTRSLPAVFL